MPSSAMTCASKEAGLQPDVPVPFSLPYAAGQDPQREAAIEEMRRILRARTPQAPMAVAVAVQRISVLAILMPKPSRPT